MIGLFEEQPLLMVPFILVVVVAYDLAKQLVRALIRRREERGL